MVGAARFPGHRDRRVWATPGRSSRSNSAGRLANEITSWATAPERTKASIDAPNRLNADSS